MAEFIGMRPSVGTQSALLLLLLFLAVIPGQSLLQLAGPHGAVVFGKSLATVLMLGSGIVSTSIRVPLLMLGPVRFPLPVLLGLKGIGYVNFRRMLNRRIPTREARLGTTALVDWNRHSSKRINSPKTKKTQSDARASAELRYQRRLKEITEALPATSIGKIFRYVQTLDEEGCIQRVTCELTVDPSIAGGIGKELLSFLTSLDNSDETAPWIKYQEAVRTGKFAGSRKACQRKFNQCSQSTKAIVSEARKRLIAAMMVR